MTVASSLRDYYPIVIVTLLLPGVVLLIHLANRRTPLKRCRHCAATTAGQVEYTRHREVARGVFECTVCRTVQQG